MLGMSVHLGITNVSPAPKHIPEFLKNYHRTIKNHFEKRELANVLFGFLTGNKNGISPYTRKAFKKTNLSFLFSPSGIHLAGFLLFLNFFIKKINSKKLRHFTKGLVTSSAFLLGGFDSMKRLSMMRLFNQIKFLAKLKITSEKIFYFTFCISFLLGHFHKNPLSFIFSFAFIGTFLSLKDYSKLTLILGLYSTQLILALFMGDKVSLLAIPIGLFGSFVFSFLFPVILLFLGTFWIIEINWIEPLLKIFVASIQMSAKLLNGSFSSSSIFLILAIWIILIRPKAMGYASIAILIFCHTNTAMTPVIFT